MNFTRAGLKAVNQNLVQTQQPVQTLPGMAGFSSVQSGVWVVKAKQTDYRILWWICNLNWELQRANCMWTHLPILKPSTKWMSISILFWCKIVRLLWRGINQSENEFVKRQWWTWRTWARQWTQVRRAFVAFLSASAMMHLSSESEWNIANVSFPRCNKNVTFCYNLFSSIHNTWSSGCLIIRLLFSDDFKISGLVLETRVKELTFVALFFSGSLRIQAATVALLKVLIALNKHVKWALNLCLNQLKWRYSTYTLKGRMWWRMNMTRRSKLRLS